MMLTEAEIDTILRLIGESYPIQRRRNGEWSKETHDAIAALRARLEGYC